MPLRIILLSFMFLLPLLAGCAETSVGPPAQSGDVTRMSGHLGDYQRTMRDLYSINDDIKIGEQVMAAQIKEFKRKKVGVDLPRDSALKARIENIVRRLAPVTDLPDLPYEVHIFDRPDIANAYCMPGGKIGVFTGIFDSEKGLVNAASDDEIAAVLGHEMAHASLRHVTRQLTTLQSIGFFGNLASIFIGQGVGQQAQYAFNQVFSMGMNIYIPSYTRKYESQADQAGFYTMSRAHFDPQAAVNVWTRAAGKKGAHSKTDFFADHPASAERARRLEHWLPEAQMLATGKTGLKPAFTTDQQL